MKIKPHIFVLLAVLIVTGMIVSPVSAGTTILYDEDCVIGLYYIDVPPPDNLPGICFGPYPSGEVCGYTGAATHAQPFDFCPVDWGVPNNTEMWLQGYDNYNGHYFTNTTDNFLFYNMSGIVTPVASFTCTPTSQFPDTDVVCTDTSTNTPTDWYWSIDAEAMGIDSWQTSTNRNMTWQSHYPGFYSVNLRANNSAGSDWENKTNYVLISENATPNTCSIPPLAGYHRTLFQCTDSNMDGAISGCDIQLRDLEGGAWSNQTDIASGVWCIDTLPLHHINGYGQATGYSDGTRLNVQEWNGMTYTILMYPGYVPPAAEGKVWVYVHVMENGADLSGVYVSLSGSGQTTKSDTTDGSGVVRIQWPNVTTAYINAVKAGYTTGIKVITTSAFGPDFIDIDLHKGTQTLTIVPTTGPGGTVPTTIGPWGTPGPEGTMPAGYTNAQGQAMMDWLALNGMDLVQLAFLVTLLALVGVKMGGK